GLRSCGSYVEPGRSSAVAADRSRLMSDRPGAVRLRRTPGRSMNQRCDTLGPAPGKPAQRDSNAFDSPIACRTAGAGDVAGGGGEPAAGPVQERLFDQKQMG